MDVHLSRSVPRYLGIRALQFCREPEILDDERICTRPVCIPRHLQGTVKLGRQHLYVHGHIDLDIAQVRILACDGQRFDGEVPGVSAGVELVQPEVNGIGSSPYRRMQALHRPRRRQ